MSFDPAMERRHPTAAPPRPPAPPAASALAEAAPLRPQPVDGGRVTWWPAASRLERVVQLLVALGCWVAVLIALWLNPDPQGVGTHEQLGLLPCGFYQITGRPCPGCGMTTSFAHMAHGQIVSGVVVQPFGAALFAVTLAMAVALPVTAARGRSWTLMLMRFHASAWLFGLVALALASWGYKIIYGQVTGHFSP